MNIFDKCTYFRVDLLNMSEDLRNELSKIYSIDSDCASLQVLKEHIDQLDIPSNLIDDEYEIDEDELRYIFEAFLGNYPFYLLFGESIRWNGNDGYKIVCDILDLVDPTTNSLDIIENPNSKTAIGLLSNHDVPTGSRVIITGLTDEEADMLSEYEFNEIEDFVRQRCK